MKLKVHRNASFPFDKMMLLLLPLLCSSLSPLLVLSINTTQNQSKRILGLQTKDFEKTYDLPVSGHPSMPVIVLIRMMGCDRGGRILCEAQTETGEGVFLRTRKQVLKRQGSNRNSWSMLLYNKQKIDLYITGFNHRKHILKRLGCIWEA